MALETVPGKMPEELPGVTVDFTEHYIKFSLFVPRIFDQELENGFVSQVTKALRGYLDDLKPSLSIFGAFNRIIKSRREASADQQEKAA